MDLKMMKQGMLLCMSLGWVSAGCGSKNTPAPEEANITNLEWTDGNATVSPGRSIAIDGKVLSNVNSQVDFVITDAANNEIGQAADSLRVVSQNPPAGKNSFSLQDDMGVQVAAGSKACNGNYILNVNVKAGRSSIVKPLYFEVVDGQDCKPASGVSSKKGAVHNVLGPQEGAFDLVNGRAVDKSAPNTNKDLLDRTSIGSATPGGGFRRALASGNHARFIVDNSVPYESISGDNIASIAARNDWQRTTGTLKAGDIVYVKLGEQRASNAIYVLHITRVDDTSYPSSLGTNGGVIEFDYKSVPPNA